MEFLPHYDELWVISDIHMGGERTAASNFQIFRRGRRLANFIHKLAADRPGDAVALVLNGDIVDSLAEETLQGYVALDATTALGMIERIYHDPEFAPVWDAMSAFVHTPGRQLVFVVGNHDIELALAPVEASVRQRLAAGNAEADARLVFSTRGGGFACRVGNKRVFCTHGNEVDGWNVVNYNDLGALNNAINAGRRVDPSRWTPNAGTRLVVDMMNTVKKRRPFVDLLKPEIKPVLGVLLTVEPGLVRQVDLGASYKVVRELISGNSDVKRLLSVGQELEAAPPAALAEAAVTELLGANLAGEVRNARPGASEDELLLEAESNLAARRSVSDDAAEGATLGWSDIVSGWLGRVEPHEALRRALLDWLGDDKTFDLTERDPTFRDIIDRVGPGVDFVVTGHTHLARAIEYAPGRRYFNSGTWIRLLRLTPQVLASGPAFAEAYKVLTEGTLDALDAAAIPGPNGARVALVLDRTNAVRIARGDAGVTGELVRVVDSKDGKSVSFRPEEGGIGE